MHHLFHFDLKPKGNYGDAILFEPVRQMFNGYGGREKFLVTGSTNLRQPVGPGKLAWDLENTIARGGWYVTYRKLRSLAGRLLRG